MPPSDPSSPPRRAARSRSATPLLAGAVLGTVLTALTVVGLTPPQAPVAQAAPAQQPLARQVPDPVPAAAVEPEPVGARLPVCAGVVTELSPRDRLAQRLMVGVDAADPDAAAELVRTHQVGGIFLPGNATALLTEQNLRALQAMARLPVAVAVDDEGGRVQRIDELDGDLPSAAEMGAMNPGQVRELGAERGRQLAARGVTVDLAPVVDLGGQPRRAVIGDRAFSTDPAEVTEYALAFAEGLRSAGVDVALKHFPGHGRADGDSHAGRVSTPPLEQLREADLRPYAELIGPGGPLADATTAVMVGHLDVPGLTDGLPSSLTPAVYRLLREELGFTGMIVTDDLGAMRAITGTYALPEAVLAALDAGADMALWSSGGDVTPVLDALEPALADGTLDPAENDAAVTRVLRNRGVCS